MFHTAISGEQAEDNLRCRPAQFRIGHFVTPAGKARDLGRRDVGENPALLLEVDSGFLQQFDDLFPPVGVQQEGVRAVRSISGVISRSPRRSRNFLGFAA